MHLFDTLDRRDFDVQCNTEPAFSYLNRSARPAYRRIRSELERWFSHYPCDEQAALRGAFRSTIDSQHQAAFFELYLHEILIRSDCTVEIHPSLPDTSGRPDFFVRPPKSRPFYLEAKLVSFESDVASEARMSVVYDILNKRVDSTNFFLSLDMKGAPATPPPGSSWANRLNRELRQLDPDIIGESLERGGLESLPTWEFEHDGWSVTVRPIPWKRPLRGRATNRAIGIRSYASQWLDQRTPLRDAVKDKARKYGELGIPYVVAIDALESLDLIDIMEALFGEEIYTLPFEDSGSTQKSELRMIRKPDGVWTSPRGPSCAGLSAVMIVEQLVPWSVCRVEPRLYHNPWAQEPLSAGLVGLPEAVPVEGHMQLLDGQSASEILGLLPSWPLSK